MIGLYSYFRKIIFVFFWWKERRKVRLEVRERFIGSLL